MDYGQAIFNYCIGQGIPAALANLIVAQAKHETADFTSNAFVTCNNCFGYKWIGQATASGPCITSTEGDSYASYDSIEGSVKELILWIHRRQAEGIFPQDLTTITTPLQYAGYLQSAGFYTASIDEYTAGLVKWLNAYKTPILISGGLLALAFWGYLGYQFLKKPKK